MSDRIASGVTEDELHALVDGELTSARAAEVSHWLSQRPQDAARVLAWQAQRAQLRELHHEVLAAPVPEALTRALRPPRAWLWRQGAAAAALLCTGLVGGWALHAQLRAPSARMQAALPAFVNDAAVAHAVYVPEKRHPVEVGAEQQAHLVRWLSNRLGGELALPSLAPQGFQLVGGRLLPGDGAAPRAQFMYEDAHGQRVTLYVSVIDPAPAGAAPTAFRFASVVRGEHTTQSFYWVDGRWGYALSAELARETLAALADALYPQLRRVAPE